MMTMNSDEIRFQSVLILELGNNGRQDRQLEILVTLSI